MRDKVKAVLKQHPAGDNDETTEMQFVHPETSDILEDEDPIADLKDNAIVHVVFAVAENEYESIDVVSMALQES